MPEKQITPDREFLPESLAVKRWGLSRQTLWRMRMAGLPFYRANSKILYDIAEVEAFMRRDTRSQTAVAA